MQVDDIIHVQNYKGETKNRSCIVVNVRDTQVTPISFDRTYRKNKSLKRSQILITVQDMQEKCFRSYYLAYLDYTYGRTL